MKNVYEVKLVFNERGVKCTAVCEVHVTGWPDNCCVSPYIYFSTHHTHRRYMSPTSCQNKAL